MKIHQSFDAKLQSSSKKGAHVYVVWPHSATYFGTRGRIKVSGQINGYPFTSSFMPLGDGNHKLPVKKEIRDALNVRIGDEVSVVLEQKID